MHRADEVDGVEIAERATGLVDVLLRGGRGPRSAGVRPRAATPVLVGLDNDLSVEATPRTLAEATPTTASRRGLSQRSASWRSSSRSLLAVRSRGA